MFKSYIQLIIVIFIYTTSACNNKPRIEKTSKYNFNIINGRQVSNDKRGKYSEFYSQIGGFQLDTIGGLVGQLSKFKVFNNKIFILDIRFAKKLFVYSIDGKFLFSISKKGKGPGEFIRISDFEIDEENNQILITDMAQRKIIIFTENGTFIEEKRLGFSPIFLRNKAVSFISLRFPIKKLKTL